MNESQLGGYSDLADNIVQEIVPPAAEEVHGGLTYWNDNVYVAAYNLPVAAYSFNSGSGGLLSLAPTSQTPRVTAHPQGGIVSSNGTNDAIFSYVSVPTSILFAFDATNLANEFYDSTMAGARDKFGPTVHYEMPVVADGRVYINGETKLSVFGLLPDLAATAGNNQTGVVKTKLPITLQAQLQSPYSGAIKTSGIPVTFKVTGGAGTLSNPEATTNSSGIASTSYTLPPKPATYTITASSPGYASATFTETATLGAPASLAISSGNQQKEAVASQLDEPLKVRVKDSAGNGVPGLAVSFSDGGAGGTVSSPTATTDSSGYATTSYKTGTKAGTVSITASVTGLKSVVFKETVLSGPATTMSVYSGNNQSVKAGATAPKELEVLVVDKYSNPVNEVSVTYNAGGAGGSFSPNPAETNPKGIAGTRYTTPTKTGTVTVTASASGLSSVQFTITVH